MDALINVNGENFQTLQILLLTTLITLLPSIVVMMTSFTRYIISLSFLRSAIGLQQNPPNMVLVGMALFLTLFTMSPVISLSLIHISVSICRHFNSASVLKT